MGGDQVNYHINLDQDHHRRSRMFRARRPSFHPDIFISCADGMAQSDQMVARAQKAFFEAWLKRELSGDELRKVTDEFIVFYTKMGKNRA
jgi:hypothetical protein